MGSGDVGWVGATPMEFFIVLRINAGTDVPACDMAPLWGSQCRVIRVVGVLEKKMCRPIELLCSSFWAAPRQSSNKLDFALGLHHCLAPQDILGCASAKFEQA